MSKSLSVQKKKRKIDFQDGRHSDRHDFSYVFFFFFFFFDYKSPRCFLLSLESSGLSVQEKKRKIDFQDGGHLGFSIGTVLATFGLQVTLMLPTKYRVSWPRGVGVVGF